MTREKVIDLLNMIVLEFDGFAVDGNVLNLWHELLADIPDDIGMAAGKVVMLKATFRPRVAEIRQAALALLRPETTMDNSQAWGLVLQAIRRFGKSQREKAFASLPPAVASAAKRFGWNDLCDGEEMVNRAHFLKMFDSMQANDKQIGVLPPALQAHFRQAALATDAPVSLAELLTKALPAHETSVSRPASNVVPLKRKPQARTPEELREQAEHLKRALQKEAV